MNTIRQALIFALLALAVAVSLSGFAAKDMKMKKPREFDALETPTKPPAPTPAAPAQ